MKGRQPSDLAVNGHAVQFYERESYLLDSVSEYIGSALSAASAGILIATPPHRDGVAQRLSARGLDVVGARAQGRYVALDARDTLSRFMVDGWPDQARFDDTIGTLISTTRERAPQVHAFGEMVALLWAEGNSDAAIRLASSRSCSSKPRRSKPRRSSDGTPKRSCARRWSSSRMRTGARMSSSRCSDTSFAIRSRR